MQIDKKNIENVSFYRKNRKKQIENFIFFNWTFFTVYFSILCKFTRKMGKSNFTGTAKMVDLWLISDSKFHFSILLLVGAENLGKIDSGLHGTWSGHNVILQHDLTESR